MNIVKLGKNGYEISKEDIEKVVVDLGDRVKKQYGNIEMFDNWLDADTYGMKGIVNDLCYIVLGEEPTLIVSKTCDIEEYNKIA